MEAWTLLLPVRRAAPAARIFLPWSRHVPRDHPSPGHPAGGKRKGKRRALTRSVEEKARGCRARAVRHTRRRIFWPGGVEANPPPPPAATSPRTKPRRVPGHRLPHRKQASRRVTGGHDHGPARRCPTVSGRGTDTGGRRRPPRRGSRHRQGRRSATTVSRPARASNESNGLLPILQMVAGRRARPERVAD